MPEDRPRPPKPKKIKFSSLSQEDQRKIKAFLKQEGDLNSKEYPTLSQLGEAFLNLYLGKTDRTERKYDPEDFLRVLDEKPAKTKIVIERLANQIDPKYESIHPTWAREILLQLLAEGRIEGGLDENFGGYVWQKKKQEA
ncbi:MAG: hypothetical protein QUS12_09755 [Methanosarcina sp.]|nr:hypothetical protein [Methanosarcina sp.]